MTSVDSLLKCCALGRCMVLKDLKKCGSCGLVAYCCKEHQVEHFKDGGHKMICPGREGKEPLTFKNCMEKAAKFYSQEMWVAALPYYSAMLELTERQVGTLHMQNAGLLEVMSKCYRHQNKFSEAVQCLQRSIIIRDMHNDGSPEKNVASISTLGLLAEYYILGGQIQLAKDLLLKTEEQAKAVFGESSLQRGRILCTLAVCCEGLGDAAEAERYLRMACSLEEYANPSKPEDKAAAFTGFYNLGVLLAKREGVSDCVGFLETALRFKRETGVSEDDPDIVTLNELISDVQKSS